MKLTLVFLFACFLSFGQNEKPDSRFAFGAYGFGYKKYYTQIFAGLLFDAKPKGKKRFEFSTSAAYYRIGYGNNLGYRLNSLALTSGTSWDFTIGNVHLKPGIQIGYLHSDKVDDIDHTYKFHGGGVLTKLDLYYQFKRISVGGRGSYMIAGGGELVDTPYTEEPYVSYSSLKVLIEFGVSVRYHF